MVVYKLFSEGYDEIDYQLIAIHSTIEDFRLAYFINKSLSINLSKSPEDISIHENSREMNFSRFTFQDTENNVLWDFFQNKSVDSQNAALLNTGLFADKISQVSSQAHLLPEFKRVDFFLKVEKQFAIDEIQETISRIKKIQKVSTVYSIDAEKVKSKNNLIF